VALPKALLRLIGEISKSLTELQAKVEKELKKGQPGRLNREASQSRVAGG
jgi:hypothetical protein